MALPEAFILLKDYLRENFNAVPAAGGREITKKCHLCGDSHNSSSRHMYIGVNKNSGLISYNCFKCNSAGIVTPQFLRDMGCYDYGIIKAIGDYNESRLRDPSNQWVRSVESAHIYTPIMVYRNDDTTNLYKLGYINSRIGTNLSIRDLPNLKIALNLYDYLNANNVDRLTRHPDIVSQLDRYFVGFVSSDGSYVNLRRIVQEGVVAENADRRYIQYNVFGKVDNSTRFFVLPEIVNTCNQNGIDIYITEGPFDALSVKLNILQNRTDIGQTIVSAVCGSSYINLVKYFLQMYGFINVRFHVCPDADVENYKIYRIKDFLVPLGIPVYMHRNIYPGEKDFGVPRNRINEQIVKL